jgi:hypothetical protein
MKLWLKLHVYCPIFALFLLENAGCSGRKAVSITETPQSISQQSGYILVSTVATDPATGPGVVAVFNSEGLLSRILFDYYTNSEFVTGSGFISPDKIALAIDGGDRIEIFDLLTNAVTPSVNAALTATPIRHLASSSLDGSLFIAESNLNTVEKFTLDADKKYVRAQTVTNNGVCTMSSPWGVTYIPGDDRIAVISNAASGRLSVFRASDGVCVSHATGAPLNANTPTAVAFHPLTGKLLVTFTASHAVWAMNQDGTSATQIFLNAAIINTPRAITSDASGAIYVGSSGTDTIEKLNWSGSGLATRALNRPLIGPGVTSQNATSITVIP